MVNVKGTLSTVEGAASRLKKEIDEYNLLDQASPNIPPIAPELSIQSMVAANIDKPLSERLEAFEDILESEVGDTNMIRARNLERATGLRQLFLKFEGNNPTGTQKDRIAFSQVHDAMRRGYDAITVATCGNFGVALALAASLAGLKSIIYLPENYHTNRIREMENHGAQIITVSGDYEQTVLVSAERAEKDEIYDANPGGKNTLIQLKSYGEIANEIYDELRDAPACIAVPVSNGTTLAGIYKGFIRLYRRGKTSRIPKFIAGSSFRKNPIVQAFISNNSTCVDLKPDQIKQTLINEPLINWHSIDGDFALEAINNTGGFAANASDKNMAKQSRTIRRNEGLSILPASTAGLVVLLERHFKESLPGDRYVAILTGRRS